MRKFFYTTVFLIAINAGAFAQANTNSATELKIESFTVKIEQQNLQINWTSSKSESNYWQVQGSTDGKSFTTIGWVLGQDPAKSTNDFKFKQPVTKMKAGLKYYRVLRMENDDMAIASNAVKLSK